MIERHERNIPGTQHTCHEQTAQLLVDQAQLCRPDHDACQQVARMAPRRKRLVSGMAITVASRKTTAVFRN